MHSGVLVESMISQEDKRKIGVLWTKILNDQNEGPIKVFEQISLLICSRILDITETSIENCRDSSDQPFRRKFSENEQHLRWQNLIHKPEEEIISFVRDGVFPHLRSKIASGTEFAELLKETQFTINTSSLVVELIETIENVPLTEIEARSDLYEILLQNLMRNTSYRERIDATPKQVIRLMVNILAPKPTDKIGDPACGTGGLLLGAMKYVRKNCALRDGKSTDPEREAIEKSLERKKLTESQEHFRGDKIHGFDINPTALRISAINMMLHGVDNFAIHHQDTLSANFPERFPEVLSEGFDIVFSNPPINQKVNLENVDKSLLRQVATTSAELLFLVLTFRMLKSGGKSAIIVADRVLFDSFRTYKTVRKILIDQHQLEAVITLPKRALYSYHKISAGILIFKKDGRTDDVFFYEIKESESSLRSKHKPIDENEISECITRWRTRDINKDLDRSNRGFFVPVEEIRKSNYDISYSRYAEPVYDEVDYGQPDDILERLKLIQREIQSNLTELTEMLK